MISSDVPKSITFGKKLLFIPTLEEMGIPIAGLGFNVMNSEIINHYNQNSIHSSWIKKGDELVTYTFHAFTKEKSNLIEKLTGNHATTSQSWTIVSPVNGLMISTRDESTAETNGSTGLMYHGMNRGILPVILIPNDEPLPDEQNFYTYDRMASWLSYYFNFLFIRHRQDVSPSRLKDVVARWSSEYPSDIEYYSKEFSALRNRDSKTHKAYEIRDINSNDSALIYYIQDLRSKYLDLREKLVHISREFGESIGVESNRHSDETYDVGLSFAGEQRMYVEQVADTLRNEGIKVFYDRFEEIDLWGKDLYQHLNYVYKRKCEYCIIFISEQYANKLWTKHELKSAQARAFEENKEYILPVRFDNTELPGLNDTVGYINANERLPEQIAELVIQKLRR